MITKLLCIIFLMFFPSPNLEIYNAPEIARLQIESDYEYIHTIYNLFSKEKLLPLKININDNLRSELLDLTLTNNKKLLWINTWNSRGSWVHELCHYFAYHIPDKKYDTIPAREEFLCEVIENYLNGISADRYKKNFKINERRINEQN